MKTLYKKESARLKELFTEKSPYSQREFAKRYNLGTAGNLWQYLSGRRSLNAKIASSIAQALNIAVEDFSPRLAKEIAKLQVGTNVTPLDQEKYLRERKQLPLITFAQAGAMTNIADVMPDEYAETIDEYPEGCFAVKVSGDSMTPVFHDGNIAIIDPSRSPSTGCYVLAKSELPGIEEASLKQYFEVDFDEVGQPIFELRPLNPDYPSLHSERHKLQIIGFVTELIKKF